ncbi:MupA/Atu3671 family FMN-dependent luciferase-like monooxygenase [Chitinophaga solisilvae]|uniref:MupA/Atu3671 family FMN-dependent luciferase-like monooxygenase n=1 Tax=Chitinophaga solisilvae TaxID=1233460 RepID=UPI00136DEA00|nr:MupA/Atu3671 family FMN-dependent luciferase-like monooxygenase [Chitinophaga solisilvae]
MYELLKKLKAHQIQVTLKDDRLRISSPATIPAAIAEEVRTHKEALIQYLKERRQDAPVAAIPAASISPDYPLSSAQRRLWVLSQYQEGNLAYNMPAVYLFEGRLDIARLEDAFGRLIARHEILRTTFRVNDQGEIRQYINPAPEKFSIRQVDLQDHETAEKSAQDLIQQEFTTPFDLSSGPLLRASLCRLSDQKWVFLYTMHHITSDGWSMEILIRELMILYLEAMTLPPLRIQYKDYAAWQQSQLAAEQMQPHRAYWLRQFAGELPVLQLPYDHPRPAIKTYPGAMVKQLLDPEIFARFREVVSTQKATLFMGLQAAVNALLYWYSGQSDLITGTPVAGRDHHNLEEQIGVYINTLVLRVHCQPDDTYLQLLDNVRQITLDAYRHQVYPFDELLDELNLRRDMSRNPLFDVMVSLHNNDVNPAGQQEPDQLRVCPYAYTEEAGLVSKLDLTFDFLETDGTLQAIIEYNTDLFVPSTINRMMGHLLQLIDVLSASPDTVIGELDCLRPEERHQLLQTFNNTAGSFAKDKTIVSLFREQAALSPDKTAVVFEGRELTYRQLDEQSDYIAWQLSQHLQVQPGELVALMTERSIHLMAGMLGILKAGAAYVPVDPSYPADRVRYILDDCRARVLVAGEETTVPPDYSGTILKLSTITGGTNGDVYTPCNVSPEDISYVIYTSGSTGNPKGVMICHRNVVNFFAAMDKALPLQADDCLLAMTSTSFDISVLELLWTLCRGVQVLIHPSDRLPGSLDRYTGDEPSPLDFSLFFLSGYDKDSSHKYDLLQSSVRYADEHGFRAVWMPEGHGLASGGVHPNAAVMGAALAASTRQLEIRGGGVLASLHDPVRITEEWAVADNLSGGRVGLSFASGHPADGVALSATPYTSMYEQIAAVRRLWEGGSVTRTNALGQEVSLQVYPRPVQATLPVWVTATDSEDSFRNAGAIGAHVLTPLAGQHLEELAERIRIYRESRREHGHEGSGTVTVMLPVYLGTEEATAMTEAELPFISYLKNTLGLSRILLEESGLNAADISEELQAQILRNSYRRYAGGSALIGTRAGSRPLVERLRHIGVNEVACLIDFGMAADKVLKGLEELNLLRQEFTTVKHAAHRPVTLMQSTPSLLRLLEEEGSSARLLGSLRALLLGGEPLPASLLAQLRSRYDIPVYNMYGPTETTIWSCVCPPAALDEPVSIGRPVLNTQVYVLNSNGQLLPAGIAGELYIGGEGVSPGYLYREELTAARFIPDPFTQGGRLYRTGDLARWLPDGRLECLGRADDQVKVRGHRIEPGEIEAALLTYEGVDSALVVARKDPAGDQVLVAYLAAAANIPHASLQAHLARRLPAYMLPGHYVRLTAFPLTPNGKTDRKQLPDPWAQGQQPSAGYVAPANELERTLTDIWETVLGKGKIGMQDNFFELGGQSLKAVRLVTLVNKELALGMVFTDVFTYPTVAAMAGWAGTSRWIRDAENEPVTEADQETEKMLF